MVNYPTRRTAEWINGTAEVVARTRSRVGTVAEAAKDSLTAGRDAALLEAEQIATRKGARSTETAVHRTRVLAGGLIADELAVDNYDDLTVGDVASAVQQLTDTAALTALLRYKQNHRAARERLPPSKPAPPQSLNNTSAETDGTQRPGHTQDRVRPGYGAQHHVETRRPFELRGVG